MNESNAPHPGHLPIAPLTPQRGEGETLPAFGEIARLKSIIADWEKAWDTEMDRLSEILEWKLQIEKLSLVPGDIVLVTVPKEVPLSPPVQDSLKKTFSGLLAGKEVRLLLRNADIALDVFADLLTADDIARLAARLEQKKLEAPVAPEQNQTT